MDAPELPQRASADPLQWPDSEWSLWTYLADLNEQAQNHLEIIIDQMKASEGVTEELKATNQMEWVGAMNSIRNRAVEIILWELIYEKDAV